jgi:hypothetical protein
MVVLASASLAPLGSMRREVGRGSGVERGAKDEEMEQENQGGGLVWERVAAGDR